MDFRLDVITPGNHAEAEAFMQVLRDYNTEQAGPSNSQDLIVALRDCDGKIQAALAGRTHFGWLFVGNLAVSQEWRKQGLGSRLLTEAEQEARKRGCHSVYLDTFSFQARPFYEKHGYTVFGTLDDFPIGHRRFFLSKML